MTRTHASVAPALAALLAGAAVLAGCTTQPQYAIAPGGSAGPEGRADPVRPAYPIAPGGSEGATGRAEPSFAGDQTYAPPPPAAVASTPAATPPADEEAVGPRVAAEPVESAPLDAPPAPPPAASPPSAPSPEPAAEPQAAGRPYGGVVAADQRAAQARRRRLVEAKARALLPERREPATLTYTLAHGDTLYGVGRRFDVAPKALAEANGLKLAGTLHPGATLLLPEDARDGRVQSGAEGRLVSTPGKVVAATRAERAAALARAERLVPPAPEAEPAQQTAIATPRRAPPAPARAAPVQVAAAPYVAPSAPVRSPAPRAVAAAPNYAVRPRAEAGGDVAVPVASLDDARPTPPPVAARAEPRAPATPDAPRPYTSLGALGGRRSARVGGELPSSRSGGRTVQDAQAAYAVASARAAARGEVDTHARTASAVASSGVESGRGRFSWPVRGAVLSGFGPKGPGQRNDGVDIAAVDGEAVRAAAAGEVVYAGHDVPALGNLVAVKHADGWVTIYANLQRITVHPRDKVGQGEQVGLAGASGAAERPQVHFEVRYAPSPSDKARPIDPQLVLPGASAAAVRATG